MTRPPLLRDAWVDLRVDPSRVIARVFLPGQEIAAADTSRAAAVIERVMALPESEVVAVLDETVAAFAGRHLDLPGLWDDHAALVAHRMPLGVPVSSARRALLGAYFTQEYAVEAAALCNPSLVAHPDQHGVAPGALRVAMSVRGIGEGHLSSIGWRTGVVDADGMRLDPTMAVTSLATRLPDRYARASFARQLTALGLDAGFADDLVAGLPEPFGGDELELAYGRMRAEPLTHGGLASDIPLVERLAASHYRVRFPAESHLGQRVLMPSAPTESHGMEDLRLTTLTHPDGRLEYVGTYTAFDGDHVAPALLRSHDLRTFEVMPVSGEAAQNKGLALFPRQVGGQWLAVSRWDRESNSLALSDDLVHWRHGSPLQEPREPWEAVQLGNCGSPMATEGGWLVLTHGVGPMRRYAMGALLLDLDDPRRVLGRLKAPLLESPLEDRDGYVPNVVYSCGGLVHGSTLVLPYGCNDATIRVALVDVPQLLEAILTPS